MKRITAGYAFAACSAVLLTVAALLFGSSCTDEPPNVLPGTGDAVLSESEPVDDTGSDAVNTDPVPADTAAQTGDLYLTDGETAAAVEPDVSLPYDSLIITSFYAGAGQDAVCDCCYVELYNESGTDLPISGLSLYVSNQGGAYVRYVMDGGELTLPGHGCLLIRGNATGCKDVPIITLTDYDIILPLKLDPSDVRIAVGPDGLTLDPDVPMASLEGIYTYVSSHTGDVADVYNYVTDIGNKKLVRRRADSSFCVYQKINLTQAPLSVLRQISPRRHDGKRNESLVSRMDEVTFSACGGVYGEGFDLTLSAPEGYTVYYSVGDSVNKRTVTGESTAVHRYTGPIHLSSTENMTWGPLTCACAKALGSTYYPLASSFPGGVVIRAYAVRDEDGAMTPLSSETYFIGQTFLTWQTDIVSVSVVPDDFIGSSGIYLLNTATHEHASAYVEFINPEGNKVFSGWSEIAMNGRGSLGMRQKSFRILLKSSPIGAEDAGENLNTLNYNIFGEYANTTPDGRNVSWYRHILLRNGGGDNSGCTISRSHIGDAYIQRVNRYLIPDDMAYAPVMTFVNGEFWGLFNARDRLDVKYFSGKYGVPEESIAVLECPYPIQNGQWVLCGDYLVSDGAQSDADDFNNLVAYVGSHDMTDTDCYAYVCERLDVAGLIDQFCGQMYLCCSDWPNNNVKVWRCNDPSYMDTKWHFTYVDTDHGVGLNSTYRDSLLGCIGDGSKLGILINHLMANPEFRERFIERYVWCIEIFYDSERLETELFDLVDPIKGLMPYQLARWRVTDGTTTTYEKWWSYIEIIREFVNNRQYYEKRHIADWAGLDETQYQIYLIKAQMRWGTDVTDPRVRT